MTAIENIPFLQPCKTGEEKQKSKKRILILAVLLFLIVAAIALLSVGGGGVFSPAPAVTIESPAEKSPSDTEPFALELQLTTLGKDTSYPAASFSISFDTSKLEFLGLDEGNVPIHNAGTAYGVSLPAWSVNTDRANSTGLINIMYLDTTGGKYAFSEDLLGEKNILTRLNFRLRGSVAKGDVLDLTFEDAVFAASNEKKSLASSTRTLKTVNGRIVIGD